MREHATPSLSQHFWQLLAKKTMGAFPSARLSIAMQLKVASAAETCEANAIAEYFLK
jgi:hypothetical protein